MAIWINRADAGYLVQLYGAPRTDSSSIVTGVNYDDHSHLPIKTRRNTCCARGGYIETHFTHLPRNPIFGPPKEPELVHDPGVYGAAPQRPEEGPVFELGQPVLHIAADELRIPHGGTGRHATREQCRGQHIRHRVGPSFCTRSSADMGAFSSRGCMIQRTSSTHRRPA